MHTWYVYCDGRALGSVHEDSEASARCAALSKFAIAQEDWDAMDAVQRQQAAAHGIAPQADFSVRQA